MPHPHRPSLDGKPPRRTGGGDRLRLFAVSADPTAGRRASAWNAQSARRRASARVTHGASIGITRYFPGISDVSHLGQADPAAIPTIAANTPAVGHAHRLAGAAGAWHSTRQCWPLGPRLPYPLERLAHGLCIEVLPESSDGHRLAGTKHAVTGRTPAETVAVAIRAEKAHLALSTLAGRPGPPSHCWAHFRLSYELD
jgi:hypothetical protein